MKKINKSLETVTHTHTHTHGYLKNIKGITLIALVITIVVLVILASVAITLSLGNNGIFNKAKYAKEEYLNSKEDEETQLAKTKNDIDLYVGEGRNGGTYCTTPATTTSTASVINPCVVIENYRNGTEWYRVWSDGWIEQGGYTQGGASANGVQITLLKSFSDTNYTITTQIIKTRADASSVTNLVTQKNNDNFYCSTAYSNNTNMGYSQYYFNWYACGY